MANKLTEPYWQAWVKWHANRRFRRKPSYKAMWAFRQYVRRCQPGGVLVDCGANVGDVDALFLAKGFTVHAFEPDPAAAAELTRRLGANRLLHLQRAAVGASARKQRLHRVAGGTLGETQNSSFFERPDVGHGESVEIEVVDLFAFMRSLGRPVTVLKLDIEGGEAEILERMLDERAHIGIERIFVETHEGISPELGARIAAIRQRVAAEGIRNIDLDWM